MKTNTIVILEDVKNLENIENFITKVSPCGNKVIVSFITHDLINSKKILKIYIFNKDIARYYLSNSFDVYEVDINLNIKYDLEVSSVIDPVTEVADISIYYIIKVTDSNFTTVSSFIRFYNSDYIYSDVDIADGFINPNISIEADGSNIAFVNYDLNKYTINLLKPQSGFSEPVIELEIVHTKPIINVSDINLITLDNTLNLFVAFSSKRNNKDDKHAIYCNRYIIYNDTEDNLIINLEDSILIDVESDLVVCKKLIVNNAMDVIMINCDLGVPIEGETIQNVYYEATKVAEYNWNSVRYDINDTSLIMQGNGLISTTTQLFIDKLNNGLNKSLVSVIGASALGKVDFVNTESIEVSSKYFIDLLMKSSIINTSSISMTADKNLTSVSFLNRLLPSIGEEDGPDLNCQLVLITF